MTVATGPLGLAGLDPALEERLVAGLARTEEVLAAAVSTEHGLLEQASRHLVDAGGKRFRPLMVLLAAQFGDPDAPGVVPAAVVVELTHLASLYHDDVMDEADLRRGTESANARWGNTVAILTGDHLFARASELTADLGPDAVRLQARTFSRLVRGQLDETTGPGPGTDPLAHYLQVVADKTASLISTAARLGASLSGADEATVDVLTRFGELVGILFQLADDVLDVAQESTTSGKTPGTDLREGIATLPVLHVLRSGDPADERLQLLLAGDLRDDALHAEALGLLRANAAMARSREDLESMAEEARALLGPLPDVPAKQALLALCDLVVHRQG